MEDNRRLFIAAMLAAGTLGSAAFADDARSVDDETDVSVPVAVAGVSVSIDPKTGKLRPPTDEELAALSRGLAAAYSSRRLDNDKLVHHADGSVSINLGLRSLPHSVARIDAAGKLDRACVSGHEAAAVFLRDADSETSSDKP